jgi:hypothetical protein
MKPTTRKTTRKITHLFILTTEAPPFLDLSI